MPNTQVDINKTKLTANLLNAAYQWLDCNKAKAEIINERNQQFIAKENGNYAVIVSQNGCSDTSNCFLVNLVSIPNQVVLNWLNLYPNSNNGNFTIEFLKEANYQITNQSGQVVANYEYHNLVYNKITINNLVSGFYFIPSNSTQGSLSHKIIVLKSN